MTESFKVGRY